MKKITFILFALIAGTTFAQQTANADAIVSADIVSVIQITNDAALDFGKVISNAGGGTIVIDPDGTRNASSTAESLTASTTTAAGFQVNAALNYLYNVTYTLPDLTGAGVAMPVTLITNSKSTFKGTGIDDPMTVGATLTVGANQAVGNYTSTLNVEVAYE